MSDPTSSSEPDARRQLKQRLDSLRAAGVEWLPQCKHTVMPEAPAELAPAAAAASSLFESATEAVVEPADSGLTLEMRRVGLKVLSEEVSQCTRCPELVASRTQTVFGVGPAGVEVCFVGEAPGADEDAQGVPFVGAAGQLLNKIIVACGFKREEVYICNTIKCRPPNNRTPLPNETANCRGYLVQQLELVRPRFIVALGASAAQSLLQTTKPIGQMRKRFHDYGGIPVLVTYHPAYLLPHRNPGAKRDVWEDMKMLLARMGRPVPG